MLKRILVAIVGVPVLILVFFVLPPMGFPIGIPILISILSMIAVHEVLWSTGFVKNLGISAVSVVLAGLIPFWVYIGEGMLSALCGVFSYFVLIFVVAISSNHTVTMEKMGGAFFFTVLIPYFLSSFIRIHELPVGSFLILLPLVSAFTSDAFALFAGMAFGKHKLAPQLSPKKTVEGAVGGFLGAILCCLIYGAVMGLGFHLKVNYLYLAIYGALGSVISQLGDLSFSYIKRQYGIKDFGNIFPGHGGVLDRFDSVIFCAPLTEILIMILPALTR